jgi:hypothetical protein
MTGVVAVVGAAMPCVAEAGAAVSSLLRADLRRVDPEPRLESGEAARVVLDELAAAEVLVAVMPDGTAMEGTTGYVISRCRKPVVVIPRTLASRPPLVIARVLLPLDGSWEAAAAIAPTAELLSDAGVDLVVLHVLVEDTVPRFWDQAAHARRSWESEFLARYCPQPGVRLRLRTGAPGEQVVTVAEQEQVDLVVLGWSQRLDPDRAATVRRTISEIGVPVMLMPVSDGTAEDR